MTSPPTSTDTSKLEKLKLPSEILIAVGAVLIITILPWVLLDLLSSLVLIAVSFFLGRNSVKR
jgi:hypothetical protein